MQYYIHDNWMPCAGNGTQMTIFIGTQVAILLAQMQGRVFMYLLAGTKHYSRISSNCCMRQQESFNRVDSSFFDRKQVSSMSAEVCAIPCIRHLSYKIFAS